MTAVSDASLSFWWREATEGAELARTVLSDRIEADVCIVGGGFTGLWTALEIRRREPGARVVLLERGTCGSGASGRNAGFVLSWWAKFETLEKLCGVEEALRLARASADAAVELGAFCQQHAIEADYRGDGWFWAASSEAQVGAWSSTVDAIARHGATPFVPVSRDEASRRSGSPRHVGGVFEQDAATVQPARLALGLRRVALEAGVAIFEGTPMTGIGRGPRPVVRTPNGEVEARRVILATNAYGIGLRAIRRAIAVVASDMVITKPVPDLLRRCGRSDGVGVSDSRTLLYYDRTTRDGRLAFGRGGGGGVFPFGSRLGTLYDGPSPIEPAVRRGFREVYPELSDAPIEQSWTGPVARSWDGLPHFGRLPADPSILYAVGYSGNGVGPSRIGARILASLALDADDAWSRCGLVRSLDRSYPSEPFRYLGAKAIRRAVAHCDDAEDANRRPNALARAVASLAPSGFR